MIGNKWLEVRRVFPFLAAVLILSSIFLPFWSVSMSAPQYPEKNLTIKVYADRMAGDIWEFNTLNEYAGVKFPEEIPEFSFLRYVLGALAVLSFVTALGPAKVNKALLPVLLAVLFLFLAGAVIDLQWKLYQVGHTLDPNAPFKGIPPFTPPLLGKNKVANFTTFSFVRTGGLSIGLAFILSLLACLKRKSTLTLGEWSKKLAQKERNGAKNRQEKATL